MRKEAATLAVAANEAIPRTPQLKRNRAQRE